MAEEVGYLAVRESLDSAIGLFYAVNQLGRKMMSEAVEALLLYPCGLENTVVPFAEVHRAGVVAFLFAHKGRCGAEVALLAVVPLPPALRPHSGAHGAYWWLFSSCQP